MVAVHYERDFDMIFRFKAAQNVVAFHYERDFDMIFHFKVDQNLVADHNARDFFTWFSNLRRRKISLQSTMK